MLDMAAQNVVGNKEKLNILLDNAYVAPSVEDFLDYVPRFLLDEAGKKAWDARYATQFKRFKGAPE